MRAVLLYSMKMENTGAASVVEQAADLARRAHAGQTDRGGQPYFTHPQRVAADVASEYGPDHIAVVVAYLHDVVEDTPITVEEIAKLFGLEVAQAVDAVSKRPGETRDDYYARVAANPLAMIVKAADLRDNSNPQRLAKLPAPDAARLAEKYEHARRVLNL